MLSRWGRKGLLGSCFSSWILTSSLNPGNWATFLKLKVLRAAAVTPRESGAGTGELANLNHLVPLRWRVRLSAASPASAHLGVPSPLKWGPAVCEVLVIFSDHWDIFSPLAYTAVVSTHSSVSVLFLLNLLLSIQEVDKPDVCFSSELWNLLILCSVACITVAATG